MTSRSFVPDAAQAVDDSRRRLVAAAGAAALLPLRAQAAPALPELRIGYVSPQTGPLAGFGECDPFVLDLVRKKTGGRIEVGGKTYALTLIERDTQSDPTRASQLAKQLINDEKVDLMLTTSTPETVNPVADACEAGATPCLSTNDPWQSWYFGRGARPGQPCPFRWSYHFCFGTEQFASMYISTWKLLPTNKRVGVLFPNDADGNALRAHLVPELRKAGFTIVDPGAYQDGTSDFSAQISKFKAQRIEILTGVPMASDFITFLRQAAQQGLTRQLKICMPAKFGLFPSDIAALGPLGFHVATGAYWTPVFPYVSPVTGLNSGQLTELYQSGTGHQWTQQLGASMSLLDAGFAVLRNSGNPKDRQAVAQAMSRLDVVTTVGRVNFPKGPVPHVATAPIIGCQWVRSAPGSRYALDLRVVEHACDPKVPVQTRLVPYARV